MYDPHKTDLLIHPLYSTQILRNFRGKLEQHFNIISLEDLLLDYSVSPTLVTDTEIFALNNIKMVPFFNENLKRPCGTSGLSIQPVDTTYYFDDTQQLYALPYRAPRYVIWTVDEPLALCATIVDRAHKWDLCAAVERAISWSYTIDNFKSVVVFDLDETLIDSSGKLLQMSHKLIACARKMFDIMVLYSHGSPLHVDEHMIELNVNFDLVLSNEDVYARCNKNLLSLYNYFPNCRFTDALLVDDSVYNWTPEYTRFIVPYQLTSVCKVIPLLNK